MSRGNLSKISDWISLLPFALPLLFTYPFTGSFINELLHSAVLIYAGFVAILLIWHRYRTVHFGLIGFLVLVMSLSLFRASDLTTSLLGRHGDYQGLLVEFAALAVAIVASSRLLDRAYWLKVIKIMQLVSVLSLIIDLPNVLQGYRLSGLLVHDTGMGLYISITLGLTLLELFNDKKEKSEKYLQWLLVSVLSIALIMTASRLAIISIGLIILVYALALPAIRKQLLVFALFFVVILGITGLSLPATNRLHSGSKIENGVNYRLTLYKWSVQHSGFPLIGTGEVDIVQELRPQPNEKVPAALNDTLFVGYPLWYTHNQWNDIWIAFGVFGFAAFVVLLVRSFSRLAKAFKGASQKDRYRLLPFATIAVAMLLHLSLNTPSIELWPLVWLVALFPSQKANAFIVRKQGQRNQKR